MNKRINSKMLVELARKNSKSLNPVDLNGIIEIRTDAMRIRGIPAIKMTEKEVEKIYHKRIKGRIAIFKKLLLSLQKEQAKKKVEFKLSYS